MGTERSGRQACSIPGRNLARNMSLAGNLLLLIGIGLAGAFAWKARKDQEPLRESAREARKLVATYEKFIDAGNAAAAYLGMEIPKVHTTDVNGVEVSTDFGGKAGGLLLVFSPQKSCQHCLITLLKTLEHIRRAIERPEELPIVALSTAGVEQTKMFPAAFGLGYPFLSDSAGTILNERLMRRTPVVLLVDGGNRVVAAHVTSPGEPSFSILFYHQLLAWQMRDNLGVAIDMEKGSLGLGGLPVLSVIRDEYDKSRVEHLLY